MRIKDIFSKKLRETAKTPSLREDGATRTGNPQDELAKSLTAGVESLDLAGPGIGPTTFGRELPLEEGAAASEKW